MALSSGVTLRYVEQGDRSGVPVLLLHGFTDSWRSFGLGVWRLADPVDPAFVREFQESTLAQPVPSAFVDMVVRESLKVPALLWREAFEGLLEDDVDPDVHRITAIRNFRDVAAFVRGVDGHAVR